MPRKITFTREEIINAAFEIVQKEGMVGISAPKIAAALDCSTAPVYTSFSNIEDVRQALLEKSLELLRTYTEKEYTANIFLNIGVGLLEFAKDYGIIYRALFIEHGYYQDILEEVTAKNLERMKKEASLALLTEEDKRKILDKMTIYTHGLACCICAGKLKDTSREGLIHNLDEVGGDIIGATIMRKHMPKDFDKLNGGKCHEKDRDHQQYDG